MPAEWICHRCHGTDLTWRAVAPYGQVYSWIRVHHPVHPALVGQEPYRVAVVQLNEADGILMLGNLLGDPGDDIEIGTPVSAVFEDHESATLVQWRAKNS